MFWAGGKIYRRLGGVLRADARTLTLDAALGDYLEACVRAGAAAKEASNWILRDLLRWTKDTGREPGERRQNKRRLYGPITCGHRSQRQKIQISAIFATVWAHASCVPPPAGLEGLPESCREAVEQHLEFIPKAGGD